ncbi:ASCH domain-containing protein [Pseudobutyrivibrio sp.]
MLVLPIKKKWFDMILSGEKKEEYREIKPYYTSRFPSTFDSFYVMFRNGYSKKSPSFIAEVKLSIGKGKEIWGAEKGQKYYILTIINIESEEQ